MRSKGFEVTTHYAGLKTAWKAEWASGMQGRIFGINSEMDALPGIGHGYVPRFSKIANLLVRSYNIDCNVL